MKTLTANQNTSYFKELENLKWQRTKLQCVLIINKRYLRWCGSLYSRAANMAEKLNSNFVLKYYQYSNLKGIISVTTHSHGGRRQRLSFTLNGGTSSVAELNCGSVASLALLAAEVENFSTFQAPTQASVNQIALCKYPQALANPFMQHQKSNVIGLLSTMTVAQHQASDTPPSSVDADARVNGGVRGEKKLLASLWGHRGRNMNFIWTM